MPDPFILGGWEEVANFTLAETGRQGLYGFVSILTSGLFPELHVYILLSEFFCFLGNL